MPLWIVARSAATCPKIASLVPAAFCLIDVAWVSAASFSWLTCASTVALADTGSYSGGGVVDASAGAAAGGGGTRATSTAGAASSTAGRMSVLPDGEFDSATMSVEL